MRNLTTAGFSLYFFVPIHKKNENKFIKKQKFAEIKPVLFLPEGNTIRLGTVGIVWGE